MTLRTGKDREADLRKSILSPASGDAFVNSTAQRNGR